MKYLFINSVAGFGSTGRIIAETCRGLMKQGHECRIAYGRNKANCDDITTIRIGTELDYRVHGAMNRLLDNQGFGSARATRAFLEEIKLFDPDVIWLHNLHGYYIHIGLLFAYLRDCGKEIRWTLHDCWTFTGHCAYFDFVGCDKWKTGCYACPQKREYPTSLLLDNSSKNYAHKRKLFTGIPNLKIYTPSQWLADLIRSSFLGEYPVEVVRNTVNTDVFKPTHSDFRKVHALENKKIVLCVASIWNQRKGLEDVIALSRLLDDQYRIVLVGKLPDSCKRLPDNIVHVERTDSQQALASIYTAADVLINPTYEDTYPTVNLEALACGTPVITYRTGGSPESLDETCGIVTERKPEALYAVLDGLSFSESDCLRRSAQLNSVVPDWS